MSGLLVIGNEEFLRARVITGYLSVLAAQHAEPSRRDATADGLSGNDIDDLLTPDLMGGYPVATITDGTKLSKSAVERICSYLPDPDCAVIVDIPLATAAGGKAVIAALQRAGIVTETVTPPKNTGEKRRFVQTELRRTGLRADAGAETALAEGESDLRGIATRINQLTDAHHTGPVTASDVAVVSTTATVTGFVVADALISRNPTALAQATRDALEAGAAPLFIQAACLTTLRDLATLKAGGPVKMPPWKAQKLRPAARVWTDKAIATALHEMGVIGETVRSSARSENHLLAALLRAIA